MADKTERRWPDWGEPATKGDLISAVVGVKGSLVKIALALSAAERGDEAAAKARRREVMESLEKLTARIDAIGGKNDG